MANVPKPAWVDVHEAGGTLRIRQPQFYGGPSPKVVLGAAALGLLVAAVGGFYHLISAWSELEFPLLSLLALSLVVYGASAGVVNRSQVQVTRGRLTVTHGPLPLPRYRSQSLVSPTLEQLYCRDQTEYDSEGRIVHYHELRALTTDQGDVLLLRGPWARFVEQEVERFLRIDDRGVIGELYKY